MVERSIEQIFELACKYPAEQQAEFLQQTCGDDPGLRAQVGALLQADKHSESLLDHGRLLKTLDGFRPPQIGETFGHYQLLQRIGDGGMGLVFLAQQNEPVRRQVAIKVIPNSHICSDEVLNRFSAERQVLAMFDHPNVTKVYDGGITEQGLPYFVMEHVNGQPITQFCNHQRLNIEQRLKIYIDICRAFEHAHQRGVIHRDIKPSNILVSLDDDNPIPKVIDFGIAKALGESTLGIDRVITQCGAFMGTPQYMSPEQARMDNAPVDVRTDVYSLGVLLYELLTGSPPISKQEMEQMGLLKTLEMVRDGEITPPSQQYDSKQPPSLPQMPESISAKKIVRTLRRDLDWITLAALAKDPAQRYDSVKSLRQDIENYLIGNPVTVAAPSTVYKTVKFISRNKIPCISFAVVITVMITATIFSLLQARKSKWARIRSESLALQLKLEGRKLAAALENAQSGEALKQRLLRKKKREATLAKAFGKFIKLQLRSATEHFNYGPVFVTENELPPGSIFPSPDEQALEEQGCFSLFPYPMVSGFPESYDEMPPFFDGSLMLPDNLSPLNLMGYETLRCKSLSGENSLPLLIDSSMDPTFAFGPHPYQDDQLKSAIQFIGLLITEQLKEFEPNDPTVIESKLLLAQLLMKDNRTREARTILSELERHFERPKTDRNRDFLVQLLLLKCDEDQHGKLPQAKIDSLKSLLESLNVDKALRKQLVNCIPQTN